MSEIEARAFGDGGELESDTRKIIFRPIHYALAYASMRPPIVLLMLALPPVKAECFLESISSS
jgi:hypothetical protein